MLEREPSVPGDVVGVRVRLDDAHEPHVAPLRLLHVLLDRERGVDDDRLSDPSSPTRYDAHPSASSTNCVKITTRDRTTRSRYLT